MNIKVTLTIEEETPAGFDFDAADLAQSVCSAVLETEGCPLDAEISLLMLGGDGIREINRDTRGLDAETDVLSFPNLAFPAPSDWESVLNSSAEADIRNPETGGLLLGDIVLNLDRVRSQAQEYGHSVRREFAFLIAHSMLHLCGYDHMTPEEEEIMFGRQEEILQSLHITRC